MHATVGGWCASRMLLVLQTFNKHAIWLQLPKCSYSAFKGLIAMLIYMGLNSIQNMNSKYNKTNTLRPTCVDDALAACRLHSGAAAARVVDEVVLVEHQVQVLRCFREEEGFHAVVKEMVFDIFHLQASAQISPPCTAEVVKIFKSTPLRNHTRSCTSVP